MSDPLWYKVNKEGQLDSPSLLVFPERVRFNIGQMLRLAGKPERLMPHLKTNKCAEVIKLYMEAGIDQFKVSTLAEAHLAASGGASSVLLAHQLVGPKPKRYLELMRQFPDTNFQVLVDDVSVVSKFNDLGSQFDQTLSIWIDVDSGMRRSGIGPGEKLIHLAGLIQQLSHCQLKGLHVYDGHQRQIDFNERKNAVVQEFKPVLECYHQLQQSHPGLLLVAGGTPSFTVHAGFEDRICSPGTCVFWDWGYDSILIEQPFEFAVVLVSRVISKPAPDRVTLDMGHKAVAAENPIHKRIHWLDKNGELIGQSEEHGVVRVEDSASFEIGDLWYGIPFHICPTINLYQELTVVENEVVTGYWEVKGGERKIVL